MKKIILALILFFVSIQLYSFTWQVIHDPQPPGAQNIIVGNLGAGDTNNYIVGFRVFDLNRNTWGFRFLKTTDYGKTWDSVYSTEEPAGTYQLLTDPQMQYFGIDTIYIHTVLNTGEGLFAKTYNGGKDWQEIFFEHTALRTYGDMYFRNPMEGIITVFSDTMLRTTDGGQTWNHFTVPRPDDGRGMTKRVFSAKGDLVLMLCIRPHNKGDTTFWKKLYFSEDFGENWIVIDDDKDTSSYYAQSLSLRNKNEWWLSGRKERQGQTFLKRTTDQGTTWQVIDDDKFIGGGVNVFFFEDENMLHFSTNISTYYSTDNGKSWNESKGLPEINVAASNVSFPSFHKGMFISEVTGLIWRLETSTSVNEYEASNIHLYPNPTRDILHIRTDELINRAELCDVLGNVVITHTSDVLKTSDEFKSSDVLELNVENLPAGMYFLNLYTMSGEVLVEKVIVGF